MAADIRKNAVPGEQQNIMGQTYIAPAVYTKAGDAHALETAKHLPSMHKIAVLGERQSIMGFAAVGLEVFPVASEAQALETFKRLARSEQYAIIYVAESLVKPLEQEINRYKYHVAPAVIIIPERGESQGLGLKALRDAVASAVGVDILAQ